MGVGRSGDDKYIVIDEHSTLSSEVRFLPAGQPKAKFRMIAPREHDFEYHADHIDQRWVIRTNWGGPNGAAKNFRVMQVDDGRVGDKKGWREFVPVRNDMLIDHIAPFRNFLVIEEHSDGLQRVRIKPWKGGAETFVKGDDADYTAGIGENREQDTDTLRYNYTSLITPNTVYDLDMKSGRRELKKRDQVIGGYDRANTGRARLGDRARRHEDSGLACVSQGFQARRQRAAVSVWLWFVRGVHRRALLVAALLADRPRFRLRDRARARRPGDGSLVVRGRQAAEEEEHVH
jgi:oligopeptidase B